MFDKDHTIENIDPEEIEMIKLEKTTTTYRTNCL